MNKLSLIDVLKETCSVISKNKKFVYKTAVITCVLIYLELFVYGTLIKTYGGNNWVVMLFTCYPFLYYLIWSIPSIVMSRYVLLDEIPNGNIFLKWNPRYTRYFLYSIRLWVSIIFRTTLFVFFPLMIYMAFLGNFNPNFYIKIVPSVFIYLSYLFFYLERIFYLQVISLDIEENPLVCSKNISKGNILKLWLLSGFYWAPLLCFFVTDFLELNLMKGPLITIMQISWCALSFFGCIAFAVAYKKITQNSLGDEITKKISASDVILETYSCLKRDRKLFFLMAATVFVLSVIVILFFYGLILMVGELYGWVLVMRISLSFVWTIPLIALIRYIVLDELPSRNVFFEWNSRHTRSLLYSACFYIMHSLLIWLFFKFVQNKDIWAIVFIVDAICLKLVFFRIAIALDVKENPLVHSWKKTSGNIWVIILISLFFTVQSFVVFLITDYTQSYPAGLLIAYILSFPFEYFAYIAFAVAYKKITAKEG